MTSSLSPRGKKNLSPEEELYSKYQIKTYENGFDGAIYTTKLTYYKVIPETNMQAVLILTKEAGKAEVKAKVEFSVSLLWELLDSEDFGHAGEKVDLRIGDELVSLELETSKQVDEQYRGSATENTLYIQKHSSYSWKVFFTLEEEILDQILATDQFKLRFHIGRESAVLSPSEDGLKRIQKLISL